MPALVSWTTVVPHGPFPHPSAGETTVVPLIQPSLARVTHDTTRPFQAASKEDRPDSGIPRRSPRRPYPRHRTRTLHPRLYAGRKFWSEHVKGLRAQLRAVGIPCRQVDMEIRRYSAAVASTIDHSMPNHGAPPPTAA
ncbi:MULTISPECIES: DUF6074 family protein [unclassified Mesorhizobium]|uniref:DUF6074 family protein n=1 Tax=unclassified Mesorhizobium TaxID=325217 RepID=UPI003335F832